MQQRVPIRVKDTKLVGDVAVAMVLAALLKRGANVLIPFGERHPYDLVIEADGVFTKIQCKNGRLKGKSIRFALCSVTRDAHTKRWSRKPYGDRVDAFAVYSSDTGKCYLVPAKLLGRADGTLVLTAPRNGRKCLAARDFEI